MERGEALRHVADLITKDRQATHGEAVDQLTHATLLKEAVGHRVNPALTKAEIEAIDMICVKLSRLSMGSPILDHYLDIMGYAAIAVEARSRADAVKPEDPKKLDGYKSQVAISKGPGVPVLDTIGR